ncbi:MAG: hypothetical protein ACOY3Y_00220 [Acidobacteriota bacterium]
MFVRNELRTRQLVSRALAVVAFALVAPAAARASDPAVAAVVSAFHALDYSRAIDAARRQLKLGGNSAEDLRTLLAVLGQSLAATGSLAEARPVFQKLVILSPAFQLPPDASPKIRAPLEQAQREWRTKAGLPIAHVPPAAVRPDRQLNLLLRIERNPLGLIREARLTYRLPGAANTSELTLQAGRGLVVFSLALPAAVPGRGEIGYWIDLLDEDRNTLLSEGRPDRPFALRLDRSAELTASVIGSPTIKHGRPWYQRWWVWALTGVVLTGLVAGVAVGTADRSPDLEVGWSVR